MPWYEVKGVDNDGTYKNMRIEAVSQDSAVENLRRQGIHPSSVQELSEAQTPGEFLNYVRQRSCYKTLRSVIDVLSMGAIVVVIVGAFLLCYIREGEQFFIGVIVGVLGPILILASWQSAMLLIDIADTLIEGHKKK